jgi:hypothetical protein
MKHFDLFQKVQGFFLLSITFIQQCILCANLSHVYNVLTEPGCRRHLRKEAKKFASLLAARQCQTSRRFGHPPAAGKAELS